MPAVPATSVAMASTSWLQPFEDQRHVRVPGDLQLEEFAVLAESPVLLQIGVAHQPVHRCGDDRLAVDEGLPSEPPRADLAGIDLEHLGVDGAGGDCDFLTCPDGGSQRKPM